jgi:hypothetical protein
VKQPTIKISSRTRRQFISAVAGTLAATTFGICGEKPLGSGASTFAGPGRDEANKRMIRADIPMPVMPVVDDVGWWSGKNSLKENGPARTGIQRDHVPDDYKAIVRLGRELKIKPQVAMILCEWDKENILREVPESTWMGAQWGNSRWVGPWLEKAARIILENSDYFEFVLHGLSHLSWPGGKAEASEWYDRAKGLARPKKELVAHLEYFRRIMLQNGFKQFPETFVAPCNDYRFGQGEDGLTGALKEYGVKYISTGFGCHNAAARRFPLPVLDGNTASMVNTPVPAGELFTIDCGLMIVDRVRNFLPWDAIGSAPTEEIEKIPLIGLHWPNILHADPHKNDEIVDKWVEYLRKLDRKSDRVLAVDTPMCWTQLACQSCVKISVEKSTVLLDFSVLNDRAIAHLNDWFVVKITTSGFTRFVPKGVNILSAERSREVHDQWVLKVERSQKIAKAEIVLS